MHHQAKDASILQLILNYCNTAPNTAAIVTDNKTVSYQELKQELCKVSYFIQNSGIEPGSVIAIMQSEISSALPLYWDACMLAASTAQ